MLFSLVKKRKEAKSFNNILLYDVRKIKDFQAR